MPSSINDKTQSTPSKGKSISLGSDIKTNEHNKEESLVNGTAHVLPEEKSLVNQEWHKKPEVVTGDTGNIADEKFKESKLNKESPLKEKRHFDTLPHTGKASFSNGIGESEFTEIEPVKVNGYPAVEMQAIPDVGQKEEGIEANGGVEEEPNSKHKAPMAKMNAIKDIGNNNTKFQKGTCARECKMKALANTSTVPNENDVSPEIMKKKFVENGQDDKKFQKKMNVSEKVGVSSRSRFFAKKKEVKKTNQSTISESSSDNTPISNRKKQKPLSKGKTLELNKNKANKNSYHKGENEAYVDLKATDKPMISQVKEHREHIVTSPSCDSNNFRITYTKGQIELFNTKDKQKGDLDMSTVYIGELPKDVDIREVHGIFQKVGNVESVRLMMNPDTGDVQRFGFVTFIQAEDAKKALQNSSDYNIRPNKKIIVKPAKENKRLFVGNVPKTLSKDDMFREFSALSAGLVDVITYKSINGMLNRGFCFLDYESHRSASHAKLKLMSETRFKFPLMVDWADYREEPSDEVMAAVRRVYLKNLSFKTSEDLIRERFEIFGTVERVKKIKNYAFVHFEERRCALEAIEKLNGSVLDGEIIQVMLSKPPMKQLSMQIVLRKREQRIRRSYAQGGVRQRKIPECRFSGVFSRSEENFLNRQQKNPHPVQGCRGPSPFLVRQGPFHVTCRRPTDDGSQPRHSTLGTFSSGSSVPAHSILEPISQVHPDLHYTVPGSPPICSALGCSDPICPMGNEPFCCMSFH